MKQKKPPFSNSSFFSPVTRVPGITLDAHKPLEFVHSTTSVLTLYDRFKMFLVRLGIGRDDYRVTPGLYRLGNPGPDSPVLVTANYMLTFNVLRAELPSHDLWILVIDTFGINVWCAAGKGTFNTDEILKRMHLVRLQEFAPRATVILPQLAAGGVDIFSLAKQSGFTVKYGPVRASDLPVYLDSGFQKTEGMSTVTFTARERLAVSWLELALSWPLLAGSVPLAFLMSFVSTGSLFANLGAYLVFFAGSVCVGTLVFPLLLPWLPTRVFSVKGAVLGILWCAVIAVLFPGLASGEGLLSLISASLIAVPVISFLAMNFTGSTTFTCQRGTETEVRTSIKPMIASVALGVIVLVVQLIVEQLI